MTLARESGRRRSSLRSLGSRRWVVVAAAVPLGAVLWLGLGSCSSDEPGPPGASTGADSGDAVTELPSLDAPSSDGPAPDGHADGGGRCGPPGSEPWSPTTSGSWRPVDWETACPVEVAEEPHRAVPPLEWEPCPWRQGCQYSVIRWTGAYKVRPPIAPTVVRVNGGFRVGMLLQLTFLGNSPPDDNQYAERTVVYDTDGCPMAVWRTYEYTGPDDYCMVDKPLVTASHVWLGSALALDSATYAIAPYPELATAADTVAATAPNQNLAASADTLGLWHGDGSRVTLYDRLSGIANTFGAITFPSYKLPRPVGDSALVMCLFEYDRPKSCIWNRASHDIQPFIVPTDDVIPNIDSDGQTLAWIRASQQYNSDHEWLEPRIWTSPFVTQAADLVPEQRCQAPLVGIPASGAGDGYYVLNTAREMFHVYRLSDMHHWSFPWQPSQEGWGSAHNIIYVDSEEIWYQYSHGIARVRLDSLGPGEPCPLP